MTAPSLISRRTLTSTTGAMSLATAIGVPWRVATAQSTPVATLAELTIDLAGTPESIDPALAYSARDWSIVHSIYDSIVQFGPDGSIESLAAESFTTDDNTVFEVRLRSGLTFHDGTPVTAAAISRAVTYLVESGSDASSLFAGITSVEEGDDGLTARIVCGQPSPWLPAQLAPWLVLLPDGFTHDQALANPVGSGPYRVESIEEGNAITLAGNPDYTWGSPKGNPIAERVTYRFVPELSTRIADLVSGSSQIVTEVPMDQFASIDGAGASAVEVSTVASAFVRIASDAAPFDRVEVRQALNHAIDVQSIASSLVSSQAVRLGSIFPDERSMGYDANLAPYTYDPDLARQLLSDAGYGDGFAAELELTTGGRTDIAEVIAAQLAEVGIELTVRVLEYTEFNATWSDTAAAPLRLVTWGPLYDPHTLLGLVFDSEGYLSRFESADVDSLIRGAAVETDQEARAGLYRALNAVMSDQAPAIFLWNLSSGYGVAPEAGQWRPRGDDYVIPTADGTES
ncbi:MAG TPA: ABC transporter substrate-binding protein [Thermomicrobiales bacterium]|nr:ABC transporter substrate-binding protein [Thermomicrobiales bacterium]